MIDEGSERGRRRSDQDTNLLVNGDDGVDSLVGVSLLLDDGL